MENIGVFDSGLGGLWILKHLKERLPNYNYVFFGDQANVPYGNKTNVELFDLTIKALGFLYGEKKCACVILACNTTSTTIYEELKGWVEVEYPDCKLFGIAQPTIEFLKEENNLALFATERTISSHVYKTKNCVAEIALSLLASKIEEGKEVGDYIKSFSKNVPQTATSGALLCTHYGIVTNDFKKAFPNIKKWISQENIIPQYLENYLKENPDFEIKLSKNNLLKIFVTAKSEVFDNKIEEWFGGNIRCIIYR